ncbi:MAG: AtpZ/AtpI family protein [SAR202 cluster bacterium]|nr:AtpZ/AtpI family protein [SAR202 cluster bacterium]
MNGRKSELVLRLLGIGWYVAICITGGAFAGLGLDRWLETSPLFIILGILLGVSVAVIGMYRMLSGLLKNSQASR